MTATKPSATPRHADSDEQIGACFDVMHELRAHLDRETFIARVRRQQQTGYHLAYLSDDEGPVCVAGYRISENLAWGGFLYVDDLVTAARSRSRGHGAELIQWLREIALAENCDEFHLDSGTEKHDAHRFYERQGLEFASRHFRTKL